MSYNGSQRLMVDPNTEPDLAGYKFYAGTASRVYDGSKTVTSTSPQGTINGLDNGVLYYFAATAYDTAGNESTFSAELSKTMVVPLVTLLRRVA